MGRLRIGLTDRAFLQIQHPMLLTEAFPTLTRTYVTNLNSFTIDLPTLESYGEKVGNQLSGASLSRSKFCHTVSFISIKKHARDYQNKITLHKKINKHHP